MRRVLLLTCGLACSFLLAIPLLAREYYLPPSTDRYVEMEVVGDERGTLSASWFDRGGRWDSHNFQGTVEARRGERYRLRLFNCTDRRIGLVIAVDGRNIISGDRSYLRPSESMYVLNPRQTGVFNGWRSGRDRENRFYFTDESDSYSGRWGDTSRLGYIEVAVFLERPRPQPPYHPFLEKDRAESQAPSAESKRKSESAARQGTLSDEYLGRSRPGTGYGEGIYSHVHETDFDAESFSAERITVRYEWPEIYHHHGPGGYRVPSPRYLPEDDSGFAPRPPGR